MRRALGAMTLCLWLSGCAWLQSPTGHAVMCGISDAVLKALEAMLIIPGVLEGPLEDAYSAACRQAAAQGMTQEQAEAYGLEHARSEAMKMALKYKMEHP